jgi:hypothetical protein
MSCTLAASPYPFAFAGTFLSPSVQLSLYPPSAPAFCARQQVLGDTRYLEAAERSGEAVWDRGLLTKGPGACHGVSGNAFALLRLYRTTGDERWLTRAWAFAEFTNGEEFARAARTPDRPTSLFEGSAALALLWANLLTPSRGGFPLYELDV